MPTPGSIRIIDYSNENSNFNPNLPVGNTSAENFTALGNVASAAFNGNLILGLPTVLSQTMQQPSGLAGPVGTSAQRELKWLITYEDVSAFLDAPTNSVPNPYFGRRFSAEMPTANPGLLGPGTDTLDLTDTPVAAFITAYEAAVVSPVGGTIVVREIRLVGRNI